MQHADGSDAELLERARAGSAPAFAVLLYRHGPVVRAVVADDPDPTGAVVDTFTRAMRELPSPAPGTPRDRLIELAAVGVEHPRPPEPAVALDADQLDRIWGELDLRWPDGRAPRSLPRWVGWGASIVALAALAVLVPHAVVALGAAGGEDPVEPANLVARPFEEEPDEAPLPKGLDESLDPPPFESPAPDPGPATDEAS